MLHGGRDCIVCLLVCPQHLEQSLTLSRCSVYGVPGIIHAFSYLISVVSEVGVIIPKWGIAKTK